MIINKIYRSLWIYLSLNSLNNKFMKIHPNWNFINLNLIIKKNLVISTKHYIFISYSNYQQSFFSFIIIYYGNQMKKII